MSEEQLCPGGLLAEAMLSRVSNYLDAEVLPGKCSFKAKQGQLLTINTPGGGAWGES